MPELPFASDTPLLGSPQTRDSHDGSSLQTLDRQGTQTGMRDQHDG
jgi:hypothetical protein